jgi:hypothetical protein
MSLFADRFGAVAMPRQMVFNGETLTRWPLGVQASAASVTAEFEEMEPAAYRERGQGVRRRARITTDLALSSLSVKDCWLRGSEQWEVVTVSDIGAFRAVDLTLTSDEFRNGQPGPIL